jgi:hypothetical protein
MPGQNCSAPAPASGIGWVQPKADCSILEYGWAMQMATYFY